VEFFKKIKQKNQAQGFTLIEAIMYLAITAILLIAVVEFHLTLGGTASKLSASIDTSRERRMALNTIDYLIRNADGLFKEGCVLDCSDFDASPPVLGLYFDDDSYLPGYCVGSGGGVTITVDGKRLKMQCYPNVNNASLSACSASAGNAYYLTSPNVSISNSSLSFSTSTATSTVGFLSIITKLSVASFSHSQVDIKATSTATSTVSLRNEQLDGLIAHWRLDESSFTPIYDYVGGHTATCSGLQTLLPKKLTNCSGGAKDFEYLYSDSCNAGNADDLNFNYSFTISAWVMVESFTVDQAIVDKEASNKGYKLAIDATQHPYCQVCDGTTCANAVVLTALGTTDTYHLACVYDRDQEKITLYAYGRTAGALSSGINTTDTILVNTNSNLVIGSSSYFDGVMDDIRLYNRALSSDEITVIRSEGP